MSRPLFTREQAEAAFWAKVDFDGPVPAHRPDLGPCWLWTGGLFTTGYGAVRWERRMRTAHSVAWELEHGPATLFVLHECDVRPFIRHLFEGTQADNMADAAAKGRIAHGEASARARLTEADVRAIRKMRQAGSLQREIAAAFRVGRATIEDILVGRTWGHF